MFIFLQDTTHFFIEMQKYSRKVFLLGRNQGVSNFPRLMQKIRIEILLCGEEHEIFLVCLASAISEFTNHSSCILSWLKSNWICLFFEYILTLDDLHLIYIDEKPKEEKCLLDHQLKDLCYSQFYFLYYSGLVHFISIFATPITFLVAFWMTHFGIFLMYFNVVSTFVCLHIQYEYVFHHEDLKHVKISILRMTTTMWKFFITLLVFSVDVACPIQELVTMQLLIKKDDNER